MEEATGGGEAEGQNRVRTKTAASALLRLWGLLLLPWASRLGGRLALQTVAEMGRFVAVKENNKSEPITD